MANLFSQPVARPAQLPSQRQSPNGMVWREDLGRWDMPAKATNYGNLIGAQGPQYSFDGTSLVLDPASVRRPGSFGGMSNELSGISAMPRIDVAMAGDPQVAQWLQDPAFRQILGLLTTDPDNTQGVKPDQLPAGFAEKFGLDTNKGDAVLGFDATQPNLGALGMFDTAGTPFWDQFMEWAMPVMTIAGPMVGGQLLGMGAGGSGVTSAAQLGLDSAGMMGGMGGFGAAGAGLAGSAIGAGLPSAASTAADAAWMEGVAPFGAESFGLGGAGNLATGATGLAVDDPLGAYLMQAGELSPSSAYGQAVLAGTPNWASASMGALPTSLTSSVDPIEALWNATELTGTDSATAAAQALGYDSTNALLSAINPGWVSAATPTNWLADMGPAKNLSNAPINTDIPFGPQVAEAGSLAHEGLTAAEMQQLGVGKLASYAGSILPNQMTTSQALENIGTLSNANTVKNALGALGSIIAKPQSISLEGRGTVGRGTQAYNDATKQELDINPNEYFDDSYQTSVRFGQTGRQQGARAADGINSITSAPRAAGAVSAGAGVRPGRTTAKLNVAGIPQVRPGQGY